MSYERGAVITAAAIFLEGIGFLGQTAEVKLPKIEFGKFESKNGLFETNFRTQCLKELEAEFKIQNYNRVYCLALGKPGKVSLDVKWTTHSSGKTVKHTATFRGELNEFEPPPIKAEETAEYSFKLTAHFYKLEAGGFPEILIDLDNIICQIGGIDQWADIRDHLNS